MSDARDVQGMKCELFAAVSISRFGYCDRVWIHFVDDTFEGPIVEWHVDFSADCYARLHALFKFLQRALSRCDYGQRSRSDFVDNTFERSVRERDTGAFANLYFCPHTPFEFLHGILRYPILRLIDLDQPPLRDASDCCHAQGDGDQAYHRKSLIDRPCDLRTCAGRGGFRPG